MNEQKGSAAPAGVLMTTQQVAELLQLKPSTLEQHRWQGIGCPFVKIGRTVRYRRSDVDAFTAARVFTSTTAAQHGNVTGAGEGGVS